MAQSTSLYHQLLDLAYSLSSAVKKGEIHRDSVAGDLYSHSGSGVEDYYLHQAVAIIDVTIFGDLSAHACKLLFRIISEMKLNNVFWRSGQTSANIRRSIAELKRHEILMATEQQGLFIINPFKLRRGKPMASIMASISHYHQDNSVFRLTDLRPPKTALILNK